MIFYSLLISPVIMADDGKVKVVASNDEGSVEGSCELMVEG